MKINEQERKTITRRFNSDHGTKFKGSSYSINQVYNKIETVNPDITFKDLYDYVSGLTTSEETDIYEALDAYKVRRFLEGKKYTEGETESPKEEKVSRDELNDHVGLIEKAMAQVITDKYAPELAEDVKKLAMEYVEKAYGPITRKVTYCVPERHGEVTDTTHEMFETVLTYVLADEPVMLVGPAGTGKNVICKQIAQAMNLPFYFSNAVTQEHMLRGYSDANGKFHDTQFYKAFTQGGIFLLDEIDASIPEVLIMLNAAIANRYFDFPDVGKVEAHPDFRVIAGANTYGTGADETYSGRYQLDGASLDRFAVIEIGYSARIEESITDDAELLKFFRTYRSACEKCGVNSIASYRSLKRLDKLKATLDKTMLLKTSLTKGMEKDDLRTLLSDISPLNNEWSKAFEGLLR